MRARLSSMYYPNDRLQNDDQNIVQADGKSPTLVPSNGYTFDRIPSQVSTSGRTTILALSPCCATTYDTCHSIASDCAWANQFVDFSAWRSDHSKPSACAAALVRSCRTLNLMC